MLIDSVRQLWAVPRVPNPPRPATADWILISVLISLEIAEAVFRTDLGWPLFALFLGVICALSMLWRRSHPLAMIALAFVAHAASDQTPWLGASHSSMLYSSVALAVFPYALFRWAAGRTCFFGMAIMVVVHLGPGPNAAHDWGALAGALLFFSLPAALGVAMRYRATARLNATDQAKLREREQLARELHDTVAHHVSAIIIQAQAGRSVAATNPQAAVDTLEVIEAEATRTLSEMRFMVRALRQGEDPALTPQRGIADLARLARPVGEGPKIAIQLGGGLDQLRPTLGAAVYRLAQESITNAIRHARHATRVDVFVTADGDSVQLVVRDDGDAASSATASLGYGLIGMRERTKLLGGTLEAGPGPDRGWTITAVLPRHGVQP